MPLDPIIANPAQVKLNDPLEQYNNYLLADTRLSGLRKEKRDNEVRNALVEGIRQNTDAQGNTNWAGVRSYAAQNRIGDAIPDILKGEGERAKTAAETLKTQNDATKTEIEAVGKALEASKQQLDSINPDPTVGVEQFARYLVGQFNDPLIGKFLAAQGRTREQAIADLKAAAKAGPQAFQQFVLANRMGLEAATKQHYETIDLGNRKVTKAMPVQSMGTPNATVIGSDAMGVDPNSALKATRVSVTNNISTAGETEYAKTLMRGQAEDDLALKRGAEAAPDLARRADRILAALRSGKVITGAGAPLWLAGEKMKDMVGMGDKEKIKNTELLMSDLMKTTLDHVKASGLGSGNGFTDKDRDFLQKAVAGDITWDEASLREGAEISRRAAQLTTQRWQQRTGGIQPTTVGNTSFPKTTPTTPPAPPKPRSNDKGFQDNVRKLKAGVFTPAAFDKMYGPGSAAAVGVK